MSTKVRLKHCSGCGLWPRLCLCAQLPRLELALPIRLIQHCSELRRQSNTGRLLRTLVPATVVLPYGLRDHAFDRSALEDSGMDQVVLFPRGHAVLDPASLRRGGRPVGLIVLDGSWAQARRMARRVPGIQRFPCVRLPPVSPSTWQLRSAAKPHMLCTLDAVSRAVEVLGDRRSALLMRHALRLVMIRSLHMRGKFSRAEMEQRTAHAARELDEELREDS